MTTLLRRARLMLHIVVLVLVALVFVTVAEIGLVLGYRPGAVLLVLFFVGALSAHAFLPSETTTTQQED